MQLRNAVSAASAFCLLSAGFTFGQDGKPSRLTFDVISIKPWKGSEAGRKLSGGIRALPGGQEYVATAAPVALMISLMYKVPMRQITGGPEWLNSDRWDIDAKADHPGYTIDDLHTMYQNILADRFKLKFHKETKEGPVYALLLDKSGSKMKPNLTPEPFQVPINGGPGGTTVGTRVPMQYFCWWLGQVLQEDARPVIDKTGLDGNYDFTLSFAPELPPDFPQDRLPPGFADRPNIYQALRDQLGLKLEPQKGPVEYFVIDSAEKPAGN